MLPSLNAEYMNEATSLETKWQEQGLLDGLPSKSRVDHHRRLSTSVMLENQLLANEQASTITGTDDIAQFRRISIPMVRRFFPELIAHNTVGVQPMLGPASLVYYFRFRAATAKGNQAGVDVAGDVKYPNAGYDAASLQQLEDGTTVVPIWYSHQRVQRETVATGSGAGTAHTFTFAKTPVLSNSALANPTDATDVPVLTAGTNYTAWGKVLDGTTVVQYFRISGTTITLTDVGSPTNKITAASFNLSTGVVTTTWNNSRTDVSLSNVVYEYNLECNTDLPRVNLVVESDLVEAKTRKLRADWSIEAQQDLRAQHNLDVEAELTSFLAEEVNLEIDREILGDLRDNAGTIAVWDFATALGDTIKEKYESLYVKIVEVSNQIHKKTLRHGANWIVTSPEVCAIFESATAGFAPAPSETWESSIGIQYVGTVNNRWRVFKDPNFPRDQLIMGYRGDSMLDVGYFYCPYVALQQSPLLYDPESFCPRKGVMTRYGKILLRDGAKFYARIALVNFFS